MGRPLNKKFFGNRNTGSASTTADNYGIGGEGVASAAITVAGSYTTRPTFTFTAPTLPTGVTATGTITSEILSAINSNGTTGQGYVVGDLVTFTGITGVVGYVATVGIGVGEIQSITFTQAGTSRGSFTTLPGATSGVTVVGGSGTLGRVNILFRASAVVITEQGSGYTAAPTVSAYANRGGITVATIVLTTDSGFVGSSTNQENAIQITAWVPATADAGRISGNGTSAVAGDIVRQSGSSKYIVRTAQGVGRVKLVAATPTAGQATIIATDSDGGTYYVTELRGRKAHIIKGDQSGTQFTTGTAGIDVPWTFNGASAPKVLNSQPLLQANVNVQIANA